MEIGRTDAARYGSVARRYPPIPFRGLFLGEASNRLRKDRPSARITCGLLPTAIVAPYLRFPLRQHQGLHLSTRDSARGWRSPGGQPLPIAIASPDAYSFNCSGSTSRPSLMTRQTFPYLRIVRKRIGTKRHQTASLFSWIVPKSQGQIQRSHCRQRAAPIASTVAVEQTKPFPPFA